MERVMRSIDDKDHIIGQSDLKSLTSEPLRQSKAFVLKTHVFAHVRELAFFSTIFRSVNRSTIYGLFGIILGEMNIV